MRTIGFLGFGNMANAIAKGIVRDRDLAVDLSAYDKDSLFLRDYIGLIEESDTALQLASKSRYIFLCVKPQMLKDALEPLAGALTEEHILVSIVAGVTVETIKNMTGRRCPVIRTMPNTPMLLGNGATAIAKPSDISDEDYLFVKSIFETVGAVYEIPQDRFNEVIPVNGSSPAFIYLFSEIIAQEAEKNGLNYDMAVDMFAKTLIGSAMMILESGKTLDELIAMVSSKGGTTVAALSEMHMTGFDDSLKAGIKACIDRAYELGN